MKILITNDDGVNATGIKSLERVAREFGDVTVVAPESERSGCGHYTTFHQPVSLRSVAAKRFASSGSPVDCIRLALVELEPEFDWVLSGINAGANLGFDVFLSGTIGAAREAAYRGIPAIALSQYCARNQNENRWEQAEHYARMVLAELLHRPPASRQFWNVNFPDVNENQSEIRSDSSMPGCEIVHCDLDQNCLPLVYEKRENGQYQPNGDYHLRSREPGFDIDVCFSGSIAVTLV